MGRRKPGRTERRRSVRPLLALRLAFRGLRADPATAATAASVLALGVAATASVVSLLTAGRRPLPVPDGERVVRVEAVQPERDGRALSLGPDDVARLAAAPGVLDAVTAFRTRRAVLAGADVYARRVSAAEVTPGASRVLRTPAALGRGLEALDEGEGVAVLSHELWEEAFGADPGVSGRVVRVDDRPLTVVGVMPPGFGFPYRERLWLSWDEAGDPGDVEVAARLVGGLGVEEAGRVLAAAWLRADAARPTEATGGRVVVRPFTRGRGEGGELVALGALFAIALALLLVACANASNLLLARAAGRIRVLGVHAALGAGRGQVTLQLFLEALLVAAAGGVAGACATAAFVSWVQTHLAAEHFGYWWMEMGPDPRIVAFVLAAVGGSALVAGTLPALRAGRADPARILRRDARGMGGLGPAARMLVTGQVALSTAAVVAAAFMAEGLVRTARPGGGLPTRHTLVGRYALDGPDAEDGEARLRLHRAVSASLRATLGPEVRTAVSSGIPGRGEAWSRFEVEGAFHDRPDDRPRIAWNAVEPGYFDVYGVQLVRGRLFSLADEGLPAVVSRSVADSLSAAGVEALGARLRVDAAGEGWATLVGVVAEVDPSGGAMVPTGRIYLPLAALPPAAAFVSVRGPGDPTALDGPLRAAVRAVDPDLPLEEVRVHADLLAWLLRLPRAAGGLAALGGIASLVVALVGLYGLLAFEVRSRVGELGVRIALGAGRGRIAAVVVREAAWRAVPGVVLGLGLAWLTAPAFRVFFFGLDGRDPSRLAVVGVALLGASLAAAALPALRAGRIEPARVLRSE